VGPFRAPRQLSRKLSASSEAPRLPVPIGSGTARHASSGSLGLRSGGEPPGLQGFGRLTRASAPLLGDDRRPGAGTTCTSSGSHGAAIHPKMTRSPVSSRSSCAHRAISPVTSRNPNLRVAAHLAAVTDVRAKARGEMTRTQQRSFGRDHARALANGCSVFVESITQAQPVREHPQ